MDDNDDGLDTKWSRVEAQEDTPRGYLIDEIP